MLQTSIVPPVSDPPSIRLAAERGIREEGLLATIRGITGL